MAYSERPAINVTPRLWIAVGIAALSVFVLALRLWHLQIIRGNFFRDRSENNRLRMVYVPPPRGLIVDRNGEVLVRNRPSFNIDFVSEDSPNPEETVRTLAAITGSPAEELIEKLARPGKRRMYEPKLLLRDVSRDMVARVTAQRYRLPGVVISVVPARDYLHGDLAAHAIGYIREISAEQLKNPIYAGYRMGDVIGQYGVESRHERYLQGERGSQAVIVNAAGNKIGEAYSHLALPGSDVMLTIDRRLQEIADRALNGKKGAIVAMNPNNGDILAMASAPRFAPAIFTTEVSKETWADITDPRGNKLTNRVSQGVYPPGSVFKIFVALAALAEGVVTPQERFYCPGYLTFGKRKFRCHKHSGHGSVDLFDAMVQSCDVYFYTVGQRLGVDRIYQYAHDLFEFGEPTGLGIGDESSGLIPSTAWKAKYFRNPEDKRWYPGETLPVSIGQGAITTTPLQIVRGLSAVVNGGKIVKPRLVRKVVASDGRVLEEFPPGPEVVRTLDIAPEVVERVKKSMVGVVLDKRGTGRKAALPEASGIVVGGKTGTAQVASKESGIKDEDHAWFAGYASADNPQIVVAAIVENGGHGGAEAAPLVREVLMAYFGISDPPPEEKKPIKKTTRRPRSE
jgi:penicillin-binding protein 2